MRKLIATILLASACGCASTAPERPLPAWPAAVIDFASPEQIGEVAAQFPNSSGMQRRKLGAALEAGDRTAAVDAATRLAAMGASFSTPTRQRIGALIGAEAMAPLEASFIANEAPVGTSIVHAVIPAEHRLIEGVVWDPEARRLFATSVVDRRVLELEPDGGIRIAADGGVGSLFGGAYDATSGRRWIASASIEQTPPPKPAFSGLLAIETRSRAATTQIAAPEGATLGDVAVAADGTVYASDGMKGAIYRCQRDCTMLETWLPDGSFRSAQGMALSPDGKWLYVGDYRYGLAAVERSTGRIVRVEAAPDMMLDGIDGLVRHGRDLIAIQNGIAPVRIVRLRLSKDGLRVEKLEVLERANPGWGEPSLGTIVGDSFLYVADPQWERFGQGGVAVADKPARPTPIRRLELGPAR